MPACRGGTPRSNNLEPIIALELPALRQNRQFTASLSRLRPGPRPDTSRAMTSSAPHRPSRPPQGPPSPAGSERVSPFLAMDVLSAAAAKERRGDSVVHMEVGQPSAPAPGRAREAAKAALEAGRIGYTEALGIAPLRERIARHYREAYGVAVAPERVVVTTGSSAGFVLAFLEPVRPGQRGSRSRRRATRPTATSWRPSVLSRSSSR